MFSKLSTFSVQCENVDNLKPCLLNSSNVVAINFICNYLHFIAKSSIKQRIYESVLLILDYCLEKKKKKVEQLHRILQQKLDSNFISIAHRCCIHICIIKICSKKTCAAQTAILNYLSRSKLAFTACISLTTGFQAENNL